MAGTFNIQGELQLTKVDVSKIRAQIKSFKDSLSTVNIRKMTVVRSAIRSVNQQIRSQIVERERKILLGVNQGSIQKIVAQIQQQLLAKPFIIRTQVEPTAATATRPGGQPSVAVSSFQSSRRSAQSSVSSSRQQALSSQLAKEKSLTQQISQDRLRAESTIFSARISNLKQVATAEKAIISNRASAEQRIAANRTRSVTRTPRRSQVVTPAQSSQQAKLLSVPFDTERQAIGKANQQIDAHRGNLDSFGGNITNVAKRFIAFAAVSTILFGITRAFTGAISSIIEFEAKIVDVTKVLSVLDSQTKQVRDNIVQSALVFKTSFTEAADAAQVFAQQGRGVDEIGQLTSASLLLANTSILTTTESTEALTAILNTFQISASEATNVIDALNETANKFAVTEGDLTEAIKRSGAAAAAVGVSFNELIGLITALQESTRRGGAVIGTFFTAIFSRLIKPDSIKALAEVGISITDLQGNARKTTDVLSDLSEVFNTLNTREKQNLALTLAGTRRFSLFNSLLQNFNTVADATTTSLNSQGSALKENEKILSTTEKAIQNLRNQWNAFIQDLGDSGLGEVIKQFVNFGSVIVKVIRSIPSEFVFGAAFFLAARGAVAIIRAIISSIEKMRAAAAIAGPALKNAVSVGGAGVATGATTQAASVVNAKSVSLSQKLKNNLVGVGFALTIAGSAANLLSNKMKKANGNIETTGSLSVDLAGSLLQAAGTGAVLGSAFGPVGAGIGAAVGASIALISNWEKLINLFESGARALDLYKSKMELTQQATKNVKNDFARLKVLQDEIAEGGGNNVKILEQQRTVITSINEKLSNQGIDFQISPSLAGDIDGLNSAIDTATEKFKEVNKEASTLFLDTFQAQSKTSVGFIKQQWARVPATFDLLSAALGNSEKGFRALGRVAFLDLKLTKTNDPEKQIVLITSKIDLLKKAIIEAKKDSDFDLVKDLTSGLEKAQKQLVVVRSGLNQFKNEIIKNAIGPILEQNKALLNLGDIRKQIADGDKGAVSDLAKRILELEEIRKSIAIATSTALNQRGTKINDEQAKNTLAGINKILDNANELQLNIVAKIDFTKLKKDVKRETLEFEAKVRFDGIRENINKLRRSLSTIGPVDPFQEQVAALKEAEAINIRNLKEEQNAFKVKKAAIDLLNLSADAETGELSKANQTKLNKLLEEQRVIINKIGDESAKLLNTKQQQLQLAKKNNDENRLAQQLIQDQNSVAQASLASQKALFKARQDTNKFIAGGDNEQKAAENLIKIERDLKIKSIQAQLRLEFAAIERTGAKGKDLETKLFKAKSEAINKIEKLQQDSDEKIAKSNLKINLKNLKKSSQERLRLQKRASKTQTTLLEAQSQAIGFQSQTGGLSPLQAIEEEGRVQRQVSQNNIDSLNQQIALQKELLKGQREAGDSQGVEATQSIIKGLADSIADEFRRSALTMIKIEEDRISNIVQKNRKLSDSLFSLDRDQRAQILSQRGLLAAFKAVGTDFERVQKLSGAVFQAGPGGEDELRSAIDTFRKLSTDPSDQNAKIADNLQRALTILTTGVDIPLKALSIDEIRNKILDDMKKQLEALNSRFAKEDSGRQRPTNLPSVQGLGEEFTKLQTAFKETFGSVKSLNKDLKVSVEKSLTVAQEFAKAFGDKEITLKLDTLGVDFRLDSTGLGVELKSVLQDLLNTGDLDNMIKVLNKLSAGKVVDAINDLESRAN